MKLFRITASATTPSLGNRQYVDWYTIGECVSKAEIGVAHNKLREASKA